MLVQFSHRFSRRLLLALVCFAAIVPALCAQSSLPRTYSLTAVSRMTEASLFTDEPATVRIFRDGPREYVEVSLAASGPKSKGLRATMWFDFEAHKFFTRYEPSKTCSSMRYVSDGAPTYYDPITGSAKMLKDLAGLKPKTTEGVSINGIRARMQEFSDKQRTTRVWLAEKGDFVVKSEQIGADGKATTFLEVKHVDFDKPPASYFVAPTDCTLIEGEASDTGWKAQPELHFEFGISGPSTAAQVAPPQSVAPGPQSAAAEQSSAPAAPAGKAKKVWTSDDFPRAPEQSPIGSRGCTTYDPAKLRIVEQGAIGWLLTDDAHLAFTLDNQRDAMQALAVAEQHTAYCFIRERGRLPFQYWEGSSGRAAETVGKEDCSPPYDPARLRLVAKGTGGWLLTDGPRWLELLDTEADAKEALAVAQRHTAVCWIGRFNTRRNRPDYIIEYWK